MPLDVARADQRLRHIAGEQRLGRRVDGGRIDALEFHLGRGAEALRHCAAQLMQAPLDLRLHLGAEAAHRTDQRGRAGHHAHGAEVAGLHRAHADHRRVDRPHVARDDALQRRDDVGRDKHRIDREVGVRAVAALARHLDRGCGRRGSHHRARIEADGARRHARPVVHREHRLDRKAIEQAVLDHHARAGEALFAGLEDQHRGAVEVARLGQGSAQHPPASPCGRRDRSRASGRTGSSASRTRCPPSWAAHPCRPAGRSFGRWPDCGPRITATRPVLPMPGVDLVDAAGLQRFMHTAGGYRPSSKPSSGARADRAAAR